MVAQHNDEREEIKEENNKLQTDMERNKFNPKKGVKSQTIKCQLQKKKIIKQIQSKHKNLKECSACGKKFICVLILEDHIKKSQRHSAENSNIDDNESNPESVSLGKYCDEAIEENLVVIIFHCTLKNMKKLMESSLYPKRSTVKGQILLHIVR